MFLSGSFSKCSTVSSFAPQSLSPFIVTCVKSHTISQLRSVLPSQSTNLILKTSTKGLLLRTSYPQRGHVALQYSQQPSPSIGLHQ